MVLKLQYTCQTNVPVEVEGITPDAVQDRSLAEIQKLEVFHGNERLALAELFDVSGDPRDGRMRWEGDLAGVHWIGAKMTGGHVHIAGHGGRHIGSQMAGGAIRVDGDAGDWVGGQMRGGRIRVRGRAGHLVGAAYRGSRVGMTGGTILVSGDAGNEIGHSMRRGLIAIGGGAGDLAGFNMRAGTLLIFGASGIRYGAGMRRGTIALLGPSAAPLLPSFRRACRCRPDVLRLIFGYLGRYDFPVPEPLWSAECELYNGDMIEGGRGEVLVRA